MLRSLTLGVAFGSGAQVFAASAVGSSAMGLVVEGFAGPGVVLGAPESHVHGPFVATGNEGDGILVEDHAHGCTVGVRVLAPGGGAAHPSSDLAQHVVAVTFNGQSGVNVYGRDFQAANMHAGFTNGTRPAPNEQAGVFIQDSAANATIGVPGHGPVVASGNSGMGLFVLGAGSTVLNTFVGVGVDGATAVPNGGDRGVLVGAADCTIGAPGNDSLTVVSGNAGNGIDVFGTGARVLNTFVGVGSDGATPVGNNGAAGVYIGKAAANCTIGEPGRDSLTVVSGNGGDGIGIASTGARVLNTYVGVGLDGITPVPNMGDLTSQGIRIDGADCTIGAPGKDSLTVVGGNSGNGVAVYGTGARVLNTHVGVGANGTTPVPNMGRMGLYVGAANCTIGAPGKDNLTVVGSNVDFGISIYGAGALVLNTLVGVGADGTTPVPNKGQAGIYVDDAATNCTIGKPGRDSLTVVSGNGGSGIGIASTRARVLNTSDNKKFRRAICSKPVPGISSGGLTD